MHSHSGFLAAIGTAWRVSPASLSTGTHSRTIAATPRYGLRQMLMLVALLLGNLSLFAQEATLAPSPIGPRVTGAIVESRRVQLKGNTHPRAQAQFDAGAAPASLPMQRMVLVLKRSAAQQLALEQFLASVQDKNSPNYHQWLTPEQFGARFGIGANDLKTIQGWLQSHGMTVGSVSRGGGAIEFSGTAATVQAAFHTAIHKYVVQGETHFANAGDPEIPAALAPVVAGVARLHNFQSQGRLRILGKGTGSYRRDGGGQPAFTYLDSNLNLTRAIGPDDLQTIYNAKPLLTGTTKMDGTGESIAVLARSEINTTDFLEFRSLFLPFARSNVLQAIHNGVSPGILWNGDTVESTADVEYAGALAPNASILLVVSASTNTMDGIDLSALYAVDNNLAPVISLSYGSCEADMGNAGNQFYSDLWEQAAAQGITVLVSSGDAGAAGCDDPNSSGDSLNPSVAAHGLAVNGLSSTPYNLSIGGTGFNEGSSTTYWSDTNNVAFGSALSYVPEAVWNESCSPTSCAPADAEFYSGGGGMSSVYSKPSWQTGAGVPADGQRDVPDLALNAAIREGYVLCYDWSCDVSSTDGSFSFDIIGGTSLSTPTFAGAMALVNQKTAAAQGQAAPVLYALAASQAGIMSQCNASAPGAQFSSCIFRDITEGNNDVPCAGGSTGCSATQAGTYGTLTGYSAGAGYDLATGLGSVNVANLVNQWSTGSRTATTAALTVSPLSFTHGASATVGVTVTPQSGNGVPTGDVVVLTNSAVPGTQAIVQAALTNGSISGALSSLPGGNYQVTARYAGDHNFAPSTSPAVSVTVQAEASTTVTSITDQNGARNPATIAYGAPVALDVQVTGVSNHGTPTGSITLSGSAAGTAVSQKYSLNNVGLTELSDNLYTLGHYSYSAVYAGDNSFLSSTSSTLSFDVVKAPTTVTVTSTTNSVTTTGWIQFDVVVSTPSMWTTSPGGTVTLFTGSTALGTMPVWGTESDQGIEGAAAKFTLPGGRLHSGGNSITAVYNGDSLYLSGSSAAATVTRSGSGALPGASTQVTLTVTTPSGTTAGSPVKLTATITSGGSPVEGGAVTFTNGTAVLGTVQVVGAHPAAGFTSGTATLITRLPAGGNSITARYNGQGITYQPAASTASMVTITGTEPTNSVLTSASNATNVANFDLTISVLGNGAIPPGGFATITDITTSSTLGTPNLQAAAAPYTFVTAQTTAIDSQSSADGMATVAADLNADGIPDAITANYTDNSVSVLLGNGDGTFQSAAQYTVDAGPVQLLVVDINQDGIPDMVSVNRTAGTISVLLGHGDGTFAAQQSFPVDSTPVAIVSGDFDGDGIPDLAVATTYSPLVDVLLGNGDGTFQSAQSYSADPDASASVTGLATADFNLDGSLDLLVSTSDGLQLLTGSGSGTFGRWPDPPYSSWGGTVSPVVADFNGDGVPDIAVLNGWYPYEMMVMLGNGDGSFQAAFFYEPAATGSYTVTSHGLAVADINGDGTPDLIQLLSGTLAGTSNKAQVYVYTGTGSGEFNSAFNLSLPAWSTNSVTAFTVTDLNGDGAYDLLATTSSSAASALISGLGQSVATATVSNVTPPQSGSDTVQATFVPGQNSVYAGSTSNTLALGNRIATTSTPYVGLWSSGSTCAYATGYSYFNGGACFMLCVGPSSGTATTNLTGTLALTGTRPDGSHFVAANPAYWKLTAWTPSTNCLVSTGGTWGWETGTYTFSMAYSGDSNYQPSVATTSFQMRTTTVAIALTGPTALIAGNPAMLKTSVTSPQFGGTGAISLDGPAHFFDGSQELGYQYVGTGSTYRTSALASGAHAITAQYPGAMGTYGVWDEAAVNSNTLTVNVYTPTVQTGSITLNVAPTSPAAGQPLTLTATVTQAGGAAQGAGTVTFYDGSTALGTVSLSSAGLAVLRQSLAVGQHSLSARYSGTTVLLASSAAANAPLTSATHTVTVASGETSSITLAGAADGSNSQAYDLTATVFVSGFAAPGGNVAFTDTTTSSTLGSVPLDPNAASLSFTAEQAISLTGAATKVISGDFNGDGITDLAVTDATNNTVHVLMGNGDGTFTQHDYSLAGVPSAILAGDINGDGIPDLLVGATNSTVYVLLGNGNGTFQTPKSSALPLAPLFLALGDMNADGYQDLVVLGGTQVAVLTGKNDGTFNAGAGIAVSGSSVTNNSSLLVRDLNSDGVLDVLVQINSYAYLFYGLGNGALQPGREVLMSNGPMMAADLNGDGFPDLAFNDATGEVGVILGRGDATFVPPRFYPTQLPQQYSGATTGVPLALAIADFNGDGVPDLIIPGLLFEGLGDGTFDATGITVPTFVLVADINGDGVPDLVNLPATGGLTVQYGGTLVTATLSDVLVTGAAIHNVHASYVPAAQALYSGSTSNTVQLTGVSLTGTTITLQQTSGSATYGQSVTVQATVAPASGGGTPTGSVVFTVDGLAKPASNLSGGTVQIVLAGLTGGAHTVSAAYGGDSTFSGSSTTSNLSIPVQTAAVTAGLTSSATGSVSVGTNVTFTAAVTPQAGTATPTGNVTFYDGGSQMGSPVTLSNGSASRSSSNLSPGSHTITATYAGDTNYAGATSGGVTQVVTQPALQTTTSLQQTVPASGNATYGQSVTVQATVALYSAPGIARSNPLGAGTPTGTVVFTVDGSAKPGVTLSAGTAQIVLAGLTGGAHAVSAAYGGDSTFSSSTTSSNLTVTIDPAADLVSVVSSASGSVVIGTSLSFTATSTPQAGTATPSGTVTFFDGINQLGSKTLSGGSAVYSTTTLVAGSHSITASYSGDSNYVSGVSPAVIQVVTAPPPTPDFSAGASPSSLTIPRGQSATTTITVAGQNGYSGSVNLSCGSLPAGVTCSFAPASLAITGSATSLTSVLTVSTTAATTAGYAPLHPAHRGALPLLAAFSLVLPGLLLVGGKSRNRFILLSLAVILAFTGLLGCGGGTQAPVHTSGTPVGTYTVPVVTLSAGGVLTHTINLDVVIQ